MNSILGRDKFNSLMILLYSIYGYSIILGKRTQKRKRKLRSQSVGVKKKVTLILTITVKYKFYCLI